MVNENTSTKYKILTMLRENSSALTGDSIAEKSGVSRVAVWKAVQSLQASGYGIDSTRKGYILSKDLKDSLFPWEFGEDEKYFSHFDVTDSTMNEAKRMAESENVGVKIITADKQTAGRGHADHKWSTLKGSLACTLVTQKNLPVASSHRMTMASQIALAKTLAELSGREFFVRWPNDVWSSKGKVAGVLDEISAAGSMTRWINIGFGVNLSSCPKTGITDFVCEKGRVSRREVLLHFLEDFKAEQKLALEDSAALAAKWNSLCPDTGKRVQLSGSARNPVFEKIGGFGEAIFSDGEDEFSFFPGEASFVKN